MDSKKAAKNIDEYISVYPETVQEILQKLRKAVCEAAPEAQEVISYQMPAFKQKGILVYFGAFKDHIGFFPTASGVEAFREELTGYAVTKGTVRFPLDKPLPLDLVKRIVKFRVKQNLAKK